VIWQLRESWGFSVRLAIATRHRYALLADGSTSPCDAIMYKKKVTKKEKKKKRNLNQIHSLRRIQPSTT
jgi:hypothetical protein